MSPIFVRPVREQLEHDRLIRHLQVKYKRKFEVGANVGEEHVAPVKIGTSTYYPDLVLTDGKKLAGLVEVESAESVNNLEAMAQWVPFSRGRVPFHLYVPVQAYDVARRFCESHRAAVSEIWTYRPTVEGFDLIRVFHDAGAITRNSSTKKSITIPPPPKKVEPPAVAPPKLTVVAPKPGAVAAKPVAPKPVAAKPVAPKPVAPKPVAAKPVAVAPPQKPAPKPVAKTVAKAPPKPAPKATVKAAAKPVTKPASKAAKPVAKAPAAKKKPVRPAKAPARKR